MAAAEPADLGRPFLERPQRCELGWIAAGSPGLSGRMKILWAKTDFLHPTTRGGQIRTLEMLRQLHKRHEIHYVAFDDSSNPEGLRRSSEYSSFCSSGSFSRSFEAFACLRRSIDRRASFRHCLSLECDTVRRVCARPSSASSRSTSSMLKSAISCTRASTSKT